MGLRGTLNTSFALPQPTFKVFLILSLMATSVFMKVEDATEKLIISIENGFVKLEKPNFNGEYMEATIYLTVSDFLKISEFVKQQTNA